MLSRMQCVLLPRPNRDRHSAETSTLPGRGGVWLPTLRDQALPAPDSIPSGVRNEPSPLQLSSQVITYRSVVVVVVLLPAGYLGLVLVIGFPVAAYKCLEDWFESSAMLF